MKNALLLSLALIAVGCVSADVLRLDQVAREQRDPASVQVLLERPDTPYVSIALIVASDEGWGGDLDDLRNKLVEEAAKLGGDAIILGLPSSDTGFMAIGSQVYATELKGLSAQVVVYER